MLNPCQKVKLTLRSLVPIMLLSVMFGAAVCRGEDKEVDGLLIQAAIEYHYGDEDQGRADLNPKLGMVAPDLRVWFPGRKMGVSLRYLSGDFDGAESVRIPTGGVVNDTANSGSRKEMSLGQSREDVQLLAMFRPRSWATLTAGYRYVEFKLDTEVELVSDVRTYGSGMESYYSNARGPSFGAELDLPIRSHWSLHLSGQAMPWMDTKVRSDYSYSLDIDGRMLADEWVSNGRAQGYGGDAWLEFVFPGDRTALRVGYVYQSISSKNDVDVTWVDEMLGQEARDWRTDRYQGFAFSSIFRF